MTSSSFLVESFESSHSIIDLEFDELSMGLSGEAMPAPDALECPGEASASDELALCTNSFARFTNRLSGEWGGVTTTMGFGDGMGELTGRFPICMSRMLPSMGVFEAGNEEGSRGT